MREDVVRETAAAIMEAPAHYPEFMGTMVDRIDGVSLDEFGQMWWDVAKGMGAKYQPSPEEVLEALTAVVRDGVRGYGTRDVPAMLRALGFNEACRICNEAEISLDDFAQWMMG